MGPTGLLTALTPSKLSGHEQPGLPRHARSDGLRIFVEVHLSSDAIMSLTASCVPCASALLACSHSMPLLQLEDTELLIPAYTLKPPTKHENQPDALPVVPVHAWSHQLELVEDAVPGKAAPMLHSIAFFWSAYPSHPEIGPSLHHSPSLQDPACATHDLQRQDPACATHDLQFTSAPTLPCLESGGM